jgi:hypothetical protein
MNGMKSCATHHANIFWLLAPTIATYIFTKLVKIAQNTNFAIKIKKMIRLLPLSTGLSTANLFELQVDHIKFFASTSKTKFYHPFKSLSLSRYLRPKRLNLHLFLKKSDSNPKFLISTIKTQSGPLTHVD